MSIASREKKVKKAPAPSKRRERASLANSVLHVAVGAVAGADPGAAIAPVMDAVRDDLADRQGQQHQNDADHHDVGQVCGDPSEHYFLPPLKKPVMIFRASRIKTASTHRTTISAVPKERFVVIDNQLQEIRRGWRRRGAAAAWRGRAGTGSTGSAPARWRQPRWRRRTAPRPEPGPPADTPSGRWRKP